MPTRNPHKYKTVQRYLTTAENLVNIWMAGESSAPLKAVYVGIILAEAYYTHNPWVSAQYISSRISVVSTDTVRRQLEAMVDKGLAEFTEIDRKKVYRARPQPVEATIEAMSI